ncbi:hypothetical protein ACT453_58955, partial [Bacillus sp. D-CC]
FAALIKKTSSGFNPSWLPGLHRFVGNNKVLLVGNKADLIPKSVKHDKVKHWMRYSAKQLGLKPEDVFLISAAIPCPFA